MKMNMTSYEKGLEQGMKQGMDVGYRMVVREQIGRSFWAFDARGSASAG
jgi:hypothetical protein